MRGLEEDRRAIVHHGQHPVINHRWVEECDWTELEPGWESRVESGRDVSHATSATSKPQQTKNLEINQFLYGPLLCRKLGIQGLESDKNISQPPSDDVGDVKLSNDNTDIVDKL